MTVINNATLILKDSQGNKGIVKSFTDNDINKISSAITDVGQVVDPATHMPIEATTASVGVVQLATAQDIKDGTANKVVDAKELINFAQTLPAANGVTDVSSGDNSNQLVVSRIGSNKTLTIDNVEHADNADEATHATQADTAATANSVAWDNVSGKPSTFAPATHNHDDRYYTESEIDTKLGGKANSSHTHDDRYYTESEIDTKLSGKSDTTHNHNSAYLGISAKAESAKSADSVAWNNVSGKPSTFTPSSHTHDDRYYTESEIDKKLGGKSNTDHTHSNYLTGITKAMVTNALGYTPPTSDTNTHYTTTLYAGAKDAKSNAATTNGNAYLKLYDDSTVRSQLNIKGSGATTVTTDANGVITISSTDTNTTYSKLSQFTNDKGYITGITKAMVTTALGYTPPTKDTNTWNALKGSTTSAAGTAGYAPAPAAGAANRYLRCDGTWQVPPDNNTTYSKLSQFTNDSGYITSSGSCAYATSAGNGVDSSGGTWIRFKNGIQILIMTGVTSNDWHNFSKPFIKLETMSIVATPVDKSTNSLAAKIHEYTTSSFFVRVYNNDNNNAQYSTACTIFAMGFWK